MKKIAIVSSPESTKATLLDGTRISTAAARRAGHTIIMVVPEAEQLTERVAEQERQVRATDYKAILAMLAKPATPAETRVAAALSRACLLHTGLAEPTAEEAAQDKYLMEVVKLAGFGHTILPDTAKTEKKAAAETDVAKLIIMADKMRRGDP